MGSVFSTIFLAALTMKSNGCEFLETLRSDS